MKRVELRLVPAPGQKAEFLAALEPVQKSNTAPLWEGLPNVVVLEGYTRDAWSLDTAAKWSTIQLESVDGRNKLPGFVKYLRDRQKTAFGRFETADGKASVWVVSHKQMSSSTLKCRVALLSSIQDCPLKPPVRKNPQPKPAPTKPTSSAAPPVGGASGPAKKPKKKGFGLLGNLVGAQKRTNQQVQTAATVVPKKAEGASGGGEGGTGEGPPVAGGGEAPSAAPVEELKTAGQVLADFRQEMEQEMLDFDISSETCLKVKVDVAAKLRLMSEAEKQTGKVTMEILKFIVYEQAEEINEEWIAHKEPSEFMDEATIAIYKEGEAPPEVLEDINKGELPDEIRGQQRAIQEERQRAEQMKAQRLQMEQAKIALLLKKKARAEGEEDGLTALNTEKRDRRTIEDFERESKRRREE